MVGRGGKGQVYEREETRGNKRKQRVGLEIEILGLIASRLMMAGTTPATLAPLESTYAVHRRHSFSSNPNHPITPHGYQGPSPIFVLAQFWASAGIRLA
jgi:hypothetical protein